MNTQVLNFYPSKRTSAISSVPKRELKWDRMEVILKITERCNINCTYCYFFNLKNDDYKQHPAYMSADTIAAAASFIAQAAKQAGVQEVQLDLHGGEPMMMKKARFDEMCRVFQEALAGIPKVRIVMQTNATLIDDEWISIFAKYDVGIGISLDGPREYHDKFRVDHQGRGTYDSTIAGLRKLQAAIADKRLTYAGVGVICVVDPEQDARAIFNHFVHDLGLKTMHFLLPMIDHDNIKPGYKEKMTHYLCELFSAWTELGDPQVTIRYFRRMLALLLGGEKFPESYTKLMANNTAYTIASNGDIGPADDLRNTFPHLFWTGANVRDTTLEEFYRHPEISSHNEAALQRHETCDSCCWGQICDGGDFVGTEAFRYSRSNAFNNPSVYCDTLQALMTKMVEFSVGRGVSFDYIAHRLNQTA